MTDYRILVTGSRAFDDTDLMERALSTELSANDDYDRTYTLIHGDCRGADRLAHQLWERWRTGGVTRLNEPEIYPADWGSYGHRAGPIRNQKMVNAGADLVLGFPLGKAAGTRDCLRRAKKAGIPIQVWAGHGPILFWLGDESRAAGHHLDAMVVEAAELGLYDTTAEPKDTR